MPPSPTDRRVPRLLAISDRSTLAASAPAAGDGGDEPAALLAPWLRMLAGSGVDAVQLREKDLDDLDLFRLARRSRALLPPPRRLLINGRPDVALGAGADGVHLPAAGLPAAALRRRWGGRLVIGVSTHRLEEVEAAAEAGADYVTFGPVYPTPSKAAYGPPPGVDGLCRAVAAGVPVIALGGVAPGSLAELADAGAAGVAGIRCFADAASTAAMVEAAAAAFG